MKILGRMSLRMAGHSKSFSSQGVGGIDGVVGWGFGKVAACQHRSWQGCAGVSAIEVAGISNRCLSLKTWLHRFGVDD